MTVDMHVSLTRRSLPTGGGSVAARLSGAHPRASYPVTTMRLVAYLGLISLLAACTSQPAFAPRTTPQPVTPVFDMFDTGTWEKSLNATDCNDFLTKMTGAEQFHISRYLLQTSRMGTLTSAPTPPDAMVRTFQQKTADVCGEQGGAYSLLAASVVVYIMDKQFEPAYR